MQASVGDRIVVRGKTVEMPDRYGEVAEVRGQNGEPPYLIKFDDGHETLVYPGSDTIVEHHSA